MGPQADLEVDCDGQDNQDEPTCLHRWTVRYAVEFTPSQPQARPARGEEAVPVRPRGANRPIAARLPVAYEQQVRCVAPTATERTLMDDRSAWPIPAVTFETQ